MQSKRSPKVIKEIPTFRYCSCGLMTFKNWGSYNDESIRKKIAKERVNGQVKFQQFVCSKCQAVADAN